MTDWLKRAKAEISQGAVCVTANSAERSLLAVTAVLNPAQSNISRVSIGSNGSAKVAGLREINAANDAANPKVAPMNQEDEATIRAWLAHIDETDPATIGDVLDKCRANLNERKVVLGWANEVQRPLDSYDERRRCDQCANLSGRGSCLAAWRGEIAASRNFEPVRDLPQRCIGYMPKASETDQRTGRQRWPGLIQKESKHANH